MPFWRAQEAEEAVDSNVAGHPHFSRVVHGLPATSLGDVFLYRPILEAVERLIGGPAMVTGGVMIDKDTEENGSIMWHQVRLDGRELVIGRRDDNSRVIRRS